MASSSNRIAAKHVCRKRCLEKKKVFYFRLNFYFDSCNGQMLTRMVINFKRNHNLSRLEIVKICMKMSI